MKSQIEKLIKEALKNLNIEDVNFSIEHPEDFKNGDYSTNVAMVCAKGLKTNPKELAEKIIIELKGLPKQGFGGIEKVEIAGPGFINFYLSRDFFTSSVKDILEKGDDWGRNELLSGKKVMVEYTQPNPFKPFHIGHLMSNSIGESISRIMEFSGAKTIHANYQGDVGPHVAKAIYGLIKFGLTDSSKSVAEQAQYIGECYSKGSNLYDTDENAKEEIEVINKKVYDRSDVEINKIYDWGRKVTLEAFEEIYKILGTKFEYYFFESEMAVMGEKIVRENVGKVFDESDGAIVFHGEKYDPRLHTRVFINSKGLPTYESKEIGLTITKFEKENPDVSIVTTAIEQAEYMKVVQKALSIMHPDLESRMQHITHGMMRLASGKMSSRKGNVITGELLLRDSMDIVLEKVKDRELKDEEKKKISEVVGVAALKYSILRSSLGSNIIYDFEKSISFEGDSGPYLQYTTVRANSIISKAVKFNTDGKKEIPENVTDLEKFLYQFPEVVSYAYESLEPHHIATYLTLLASAFNTFYGNTQILAEENKYMAYHLDLVKSFYQTMKNGLWLLGIEVPEKM
ncbi:MAG: arginine--tRNA ligase [Candidatus Paceibacterota bacterium]